MTLDLNCDLGEGEPLSRTRALMRWITSANVACGGHAGDVRTMEHCVQLAKRGGVRVGAHPGAWNRADFGRGTVSLEPRELELLLLHQVSALEMIARAAGVRLHHIKLHGGLYHACESSSRLAAAYTDAVRRWWPRCLVIARSGGAVAIAARRAGVPVWQEVFADRAYRQDGTLVPRSDPGALLASPSAVVARLERLRDRGDVETVSGGALRLPADTVCLHSDTPKAPQLARVLRSIVEHRGKGKRFAG